MLLNWLGVTGKRRAARGRPFPPTVLRVEALEDRRVPTTFTVTTATDESDAVSITHPEGPDMLMSLREAINAADSNPGPDTINFDIGTGAVQTILVATDLPDITDPVTINGYSEPGSHENTDAVADNAVLHVVLSRSASPGTGVGLRILASDTSVRGLAINNFLDAIEVGGRGDVRPKNVTIAGNFLGTDATGTLAVGNRLQDLLMFDTSDSTVGGPTPADRNIIADSGHGGGYNAGGGISFSGARDTIQNNFIGVDATGRRALGNNGNGIQDINGSDGLVSGNHKILNNVIAANKAGGISLQDSRSTGTVVSGNVIGTDPGLTLALGNFLSGLYIAEDNTTVGGPSAADGNVIAHNGFGIAVGPPGGPGVRVALLSNSVHDNDGGGINRLPTDPAAPALASALRPAGNVLVTGALDGARPNADVLVQFFANTAADAAGKFEGQTLLDAATVTVRTDAAGHAPIHVSFARDGNFTVTATATDKAANNTSAFSNGVAVADVPPIPLQAVNDTASTPLGQAVEIPVLANDTGDGLTVYGVTTPLNGTAVVKDGTTVVYTPAASVPVVDSFTYLVKDSHGNKANATVAVTVGTGKSETAYVTFLFQTLLGRTPAADDGGVKFWADRLKAGTTPEQVVAGIQQSGEFKNRELQSDYEDLLGRKASAAEIITWFAYLQSGATHEDVRKSVLSSQEFYQKQGGTDAGWLNGVYQYALKRSTDPDGLKFWKDNLAKGASLRAVVDGVLGTVEATDVLIRSTYQLVLGRDVDLSGLQYWEKQIRDGLLGFDTANTLIGGLGISPELLSKILK